MSLPPNDPAGRLGVGSIAHVEPFQLSARVLAPATSENPTAMQALVEAHDTASKLSLDPSPGAGFGVGWISHVDPFHRSASDAPRIEEVA
ncbi:MAG TPA: hypothetical protein VKR21_03510 [Solirubrobacteraceae bacterium]|nr:hypothetical protein [Solirubrobacteraceae bacterium]